MWQFSDFVGIAIGFSAVAGDMVVRPVTKSKFLNDTVLNSLRLLFSSEVLAFRNDQQVDFVQLRRGVVC